MIMKPLSKIDKLEEADSSLESKSLAFKRQLQEDPAQACP